MWPTIKHVLTKRILLSLLFIAIFLMGLAMRSPEILSRNYLFGFDQGRDFLMAYRIAHDHKFTLIGAEVGSGSAGIQGVFQGPGYFYLLAFVEILFRYDPYGGQVLMFFFGVTTLFVVFLTTRKIFGSTVGLVAMFLIGIAPLIAPQSRFMWAPHPGSFFIALYFYFLFMIQKKPVLYAFLAMGAAGLLYHFELALAVPLVLLTFVAVFCVYRIFDKKVWIGMLLALVVVFSPMIAFEARHGFMGVKGTITHIVKSGTTQVSSGSTGTTKKDGGFRISQKTYAFIANFRDSFIFEGGKIPPDFYVPTLLLLSVMVALTIVQTREIQQKRFLIALLVSIPISFLVFLPLRNAVWPYYLIHLHFVYIYAFSYASVMIVRSLTFRRPYRRVYVATSVFILFFFVSMSLGVLKRLDLNWRVDYPDFGGKEKIAGKRFLLDTLFTAAKKEHEQNFSVFVFTPPVYTYAYDYLLLTYAKNKYNYLFRREKQGTSYLIMEVDPGKPWSYKGWLETEIRVGRSLWEYPVLPDLILQKREFGQSAE